MSGPLRCVRRTETHRTVDYASLNFEVSCASRHVCERVAARRPITPYFQITLHLNSISPYVRRRRRQESGEPGGWEPLCALRSLRDAPGPDSATTMTTHTLDTPWPRTAVSGVVSRPSVNMSIRGRYVLTSHAVHKFAPFYSMRWELQAFTGHGLLVVMVRILVGALVIDLLRLGREPRCDSARTHPVTEWKLPEVARLHAWWFTEGWREGHCAKDNKNGNKRGSSQDNRAPGKKLQTRNNRITFDRWG